MLEDQGLNDSLAADGNQKFLATTGIKNEIRLWDTETWALERIIETGHDRQITQIEFSNDSRLLASASLDGCVKIWHVKKGECINVIRFKAPVADVSFSHDSNKIAAILEQSTSQDVLVCVYELDSQNLQEIEMNFSTQLFTSSRRIIQFSPNADFIAVLANNEIRIVETETMTHEHLAIFWGTNFDRNKIFSSREEHYYYNLDFSKDGKELLCSTLRGIKSYSTCKVETNPRDISNIDCEFCKFTHDGKHIVHSSRRKGRKGLIYPVGIVDTDTYELWEQICDIEHPWYINPSPSESIIGIQTTHGRKLNIVNPTGLTIHVLDDFETDEWIFTFSN